MPTPPRRRWFQFGIAEMLALFALLAIVWWQSSVRPVKYIIPKGTAVGGPGDAFTFTTAEDQHKTRAPGRTEIARRGVVVSVATVAAWLAGRLALRRIIRGKPQAPN
jgi:hypothetical protein